MAIAVGCSSKPDEAGPAEEDDIVCAKTETKDEGGKCVPVKKTTKKDGGSAPSPTPTPTPTSSSPTPAPDAGPPDSGSVIIPSTNPRDVCVDTANTVATAAQRCGELFADAFRDFVNAAAGGDCRNIKSIRDINELYGQCLPWFRTAKCDDLRAGNLPASCLGQLIP